VDKIVRAEADVNTLLNVCAEAVDAGSRLPGKSYEEGVQAGILWLLGYSNNHPLDECA
jgi:hypothetical protein